MNINSKSPRAGFAMQGMILNAALGSLVLLGAGSFGLNGARKLATMASFPALNGQDQNATGTIAQDLRSASSVENATADQLVLKPLGSDGRDLVTYTYNRTQGTLTRQDQATTRVVLNGLDDFSFSLLQRPAANAPFNTFVPATAHNANLVGCHWSCSRKLSGARLDSEHIEMAPVVLRNHH